MRQKWFLLDQEAQYGLLFDPLRYIIIIIIDL
jgi:hypothetical protein